jgi:hypothetical protein
MVGREADITAYPDNELPNRLGCRIVVSRVNLAA